MSKSHLGKKKVNLMLIQDYVDGAPIRLFRAEIDIPLGDKKTYDAVQALLAKRTAENVERLVAKLLVKLGSLSVHAKRKEKQQHKTARHFVAAAFDREPDA